MSSEIQTQETLLKRLEKIEGSNRRLKLAAAIALLGMAGALFLGVAAAPTKNIEAELIILRDPSGKARMILGCGDEGPAITMIDKNGKLRVNLGVSQDGPALDLLDAAESPRAQLTITNDMGPLLNFLDAKGTQVSLRP